MALKMSRRLILLVAILFSLPLSADARIWTDKTGRFRIEADYISNDGTSVRIEKPDGEIITVPIARLSLEDQAFVAKQNAVSNLDSDSPPTEEDAKKKADRLVKEALVLLKLDKQAHAKQVGEKLLEASKLDPSSIGPDFLLGMLNILIARSETAASKDFLRCLKRRPDSVASMNNLAIIRIRMKKYDSAAELFEEAIEVSGGTDEIVQNLGRLVYINNRQISLPASTNKKLTDMYSKLAAADKFETFKPHVGWLFMLPDIDELQKPTPADAEKPAAPQPSGSDVVRLDMSRINAGGTGFVVHPNYILTNRHVIEDASNIVIKHPTHRGWALKAQLVGKDSTRDLALLRCESLKLSPLKLCSSSAPRGSDVMVLGYPQFDQIGMGLKSTRGSIVSNPNREIENMLLVDAQINSGNSGGPIVNQAGQAVAVATAVIKPVGGTGGSYGAAIPVSDARSLLNRYIDNFTFESTSLFKLTWPEVDKRVSPSTVLILTEGGHSGSDTRDGERSSIFAIEDKTCPACNGSIIIVKGFSRMRCPYCYKGIDKSLLYR